MACYFVGKEFDAHEFVNHKRKEYVKRTETGQKVTTNTMEGYFSILKRGVHGVYHHMSKRHLHRYLSEFDFRYNARNLTDTERAIMAVQGARWKATTRTHCREHEPKKKP